MEMKMKIFTNKFLLSTALVLIASSVLVIAVVANVAGSDFEIDDGNLLVDGGGLDWENVAEDRADDAPSGQDDDSFGQGTKEDTEVPSPVTGSIPPNKSDLKTFGVYQEEGGGGKFIHLFWTRVQDPSGTTNMDFEFNQSEELSANGVTPVRTPGDLLIVYELSKGGTVPELFLFTWLDGSEGIDCEASNTYPCWGDRTDLTAAGGADGSINEVAIDAADSDGLGHLDARTFGEATIDLDFIFDSAACTSFGSAYLKSRSSDSFTAALKDYIAPTPVNITNCGTVIIRKQTNPDGAAGSFGFTPSNLTTDPANGGPFSLSDDGVETINNVIADTNIVIAEDDPSGLGFSLTDINCSASDAGVSYTPDLAARTVTFDLAVGETLDCTFTNSQLPQIKLVKALVPSSDTGLFDFSIGGTGYDNDGSGYGHNGTTGFVEVTPGSYTVAETAHTGYSIGDYDSAVACDSGKGSKDPGTDHTFSVDYGDAVTCTFTNTKKGEIIVEKQTNPDGATASFEFDPSWSETNFFLSDDGTESSGSLSAGTYSVSEVTIPDGWYLDYAECDDGSPVNAIDLSAGETVTCTFYNHTAAIRIYKETKNYEAGGLIPHAGVDFDLSDSNGQVALGTTNANGYVCFDGLEPGVTYTVTEFVPTGFAVAASSENPRDVVAAAGTDCSNNLPAAEYFLNDPLSEIVITFNSIADGVTAATSVVCTGPSADGSEQGVLNHGESHTFSDLLEGEYTCIIYIDP
jgi:hypothetical protein